MKTILIVDDVPEVREVLNEFLKMQGYRTLQAENGLVGLNILQTNKPDLAIVDIEMPQMNGLEFSRRILEKNPTFPIIIISAYLEKYSLDYIRNLSVKKIFKKPINLIDLKKEIDIIFSQQ